MRQKVIKTPNEFLFMTKEELQKELAQTEIYNEEVLRILLIETLSLAASYEKMYLNEDEQEKIIRDEKEQGKWDTKNLTNTGRLFKNRTMFAFADKENEDMFYNCMMQKSSQLGLRCLYPSAETALIEYEERGGDETFGEDKYKLIPITDITMSLHSLQFTYSNIWKKDDTNEQPNV